MQPSPAPAQLLATTVVRGATEGESHGALYLVDVGRGTADTIVEWSDPRISWKGAGGDRGLRGIAWTEEAVFVAGARQVLVFDREFELREVVRNQYLAHVHELAIDGRRLWMASTGRDSLLVFDTDLGRFVGGLCIRTDEQGNVAYEPFDPNSPAGPSELDSIHLNNVVVHEGLVYASARDLTLMVAIDCGEVRPWATVPRGTHNPRPFRDGLVYGDTAAGRAVRTDYFGRQLAAYRPGPFDGFEATPVASPGFVRGLCIHSDVVVVGASPASLWLFDADTGATLDRIELERDLHHAVSSVVAWTSQP